MNNFDIFDSVESSETSSFIKTYDNHMISQSDENSLPICSYEEFQRQLPNYLNMILNSDESSPVNVVSQKFKTSPEYENSSSFNGSYKTQLHSLHPIELFNETFILEVIDGVYSITHDIWSISGQGATYFEAIKSLLEEAREIKNYYINSPLNQLTFDAITLREFLLKVI